MSAPGVKPAHPYAAVQRVVGMLLVFLSLSFIPPLLFGLFGNDGTAAAFGLSLVVVAVGGAAMYVPVRHARGDLKVAEGFLVVVACWVAVCVAGALPLMLSPSPVASLADAVFESTSAITTTGATVFTGLDDMPNSIRWYRQQLQWMGGMGIIVLAVAILPMLRIGGMQVYRAEITGPEKGSRLTPRIAETAKALWLIYVGLTALCAAAYWAAGMSLFDAVCHSFSTIATAGFSTYDASMGHFNSPLIEMLAVIFMIVGSVNFALHFLALRRASSRPYLGDPEVRIFIVLLLTITAIVTGLLWANSVYDGGLQAFRYAIFQSTSFMTTTGFASDSVYLWPGALPLIIVLASTLGGCAGATTGGFKLLRVILIAKQGGRELKRLMHPRAVVPLKFGGRLIHDSVASAVWGYLSLYIVCFCVLSLIIAAVEPDLVTSTSVVLSAMNNLGPALGNAGAHWGDLSDLTKWLMSFAMLLGRLEIFTILVLLTPAYWKR